MRRATTLFLAAGLLVALCGCGGQGQMPATVPSPEPSPTASGASGYDIEWQRDAKPLASGAVAKYGQDEVARAWRVAETVTTEFAYREDLMSAADLSAADFVAVDDFMTDSCVARFRKKITGTFDGPREDRYDLAVSTLVMYRSDNAFTPGGPKVVNRQIANGRITPTAVRQTRREGLEVTMDVKSDWRVVEDGRPVLLPVVKATTFWLVPQKGAWKIDGWQATFTVGTSRPDESAAGAAG